MVCLKENCSGCLQPKDNTIKPAFLCERVSVFPEICIVSGKIFISGWGGWGGGGTERWLDSMKFWRFPDIS